MKILSLLLLTLSLSAGEFYLQDDKQKHFIGCMAIAGFSSAIAKNYGSNKLEAMFIGIGTALLVGIAKEAIDGRGYGTEDVGDVYADTLGSITGSIISTQFNWRF